MSGWDDKNRFPICGRERAFTPGKSGAVFKVIGAGFAPAVKQQRPDSECGGDRGSQHSGRVLNSAMSVACERSRKVGLEG